MCIALGEKSEVMGVHRSGWVDATPSWGFDDIASDVLSEGLCVVTECLPLITESKLPSELLRSYQVVLTKLVGSFLCIRDIVDVRQSDDERHIR